VYLVDTDVISEMRKGMRADRGVRGFFVDVAARGEAVFLSAITVGELQRGVDLLGHRGDLQQARRLGGWLAEVLSGYSEFLLEFGAEEAIVWGRLRVPHPENALDKQIAATALTHGFILVTRNVRHFRDMGVATLDPFTGKQPG